jgi:chemotaxis protein methyltransferase CheR
MTTLLSRGQLEQFRGALAELFGLEFDEEKLPFLEEVLHQRMRACGTTSYEDYCARLSTELDTEGERRALALKLTVSETYFFRDPNQFRALVEVVFPTLWEKGRTLRLLSAGCASGEEAYTAAILAREHLPHLPLWSIHILGVDLSVEMVRRARAALYSEWALRETPGSIRRRYFKQEGKRFELDASVRQMAQFEEGNLANDRSAFYREQSFDVIFCRNVTMYFNPEVAKKVMERVARTLRPGGYLFLGHAETLRTLPAELVLRHTHNTFYYERVDPSRSAVFSIPILEAPAAPAIVYEELSPPDIPEPPAHWNRALMLEHLQAERLSDALELLESANKSFLLDSDAQLIRAALLTNLGRLDDAEAACRHLLELDGWNAGAHYVLAVCRDFAGHPSQAIEHDQISASLDHTFAMPHLHLGLMAKRRGDEVTARKELRCAASLLPGEESSRVLLFGGGFTREALQSLCRVELRGMEVSGEF